MQYAQTEEARFAGVGHQNLTAPEGSGWTLHSWQPDPQRSDKLLLVWQREGPAGPRGDLRALAR